MSRSLACCDHDIFGDAILWSICDELEHIYIIGSIIVQIYLQVWCLDHELETLANLILVEHPICRKLHQSLFIRYTSFYLWLGMHSKFSSSIFLGGVYIDIILEPHSFFLKKCIGRKCNRGVVIGVTLYCTRWIHKHRTLWTQAHSSAISYILYTPKEKRILQTIPLHAKQYIISYSYRQPYLLQNSLVLRNDGHLA